MNSEPFIHQFGPGIEVVVKINDAYTMFTPGGVPWSPFDPMHDELVKAALRGALARMEQVTPA